MLQRLSPTLEIWGKIQNFGSKFELNQGHTIYNPPVKFERAAVFPSRKKIGEFVSYAPETKSNLRIFQ